MSELEQMLISPAWWFSVVVVGIVINLVSAYAKSPIDRRLSRISAWWRKRTELQKAEQIVFIENLNKSEHDQVMVSADDLRYRLMSVEFILIGIFILLMADASNSLIGTNDIFQIGVLAFSSFCFFMSYLAFRKAAELDRKLNQARKKNKKQDTE